jgi:tetratricopeptide (TPR) repeat protein
MNLAHGYFQLRDADKAAFYYTKLTEKGNNFTQSVALNQLGYIADVTQNPERALEYFKQAILKNPQNYEARYNYELVRKRLQRQPQNNATQNKQTKQENKQDPEGKDEIQKVEQKINRPDEKDSNQKNEESTEEKKVQLQPEKLKEAKLNKEKAEAILEALKNQEAQYIQQLPKKKNTQKANSKKLPDW